MAKTYFIADLHLTEQRSDITQAFFAFLDQHMTKDVDALYIIGDFFEVWIGDDERDPYALSIAAKLRELQQHNIAVYFIHGNRDFLIKQEFADACQMTLLPEQVVIDLYGTPTVILHGDEMCTQDEAYQKFRKKSRGWWWPRLMLAMPLWYRRRVAADARRKSVENQKGKPLEILDVTEEAVAKMFAKHQVSNMIHGHTHRPNVHRYADGKVRTVLGDWYSQSSYLVVQDSGEQQLLCHPFSANG